MLKHPKVHQTRHLLQQLPKPLHSMDAARPSLPPAPIAANTPSPSSGPQPLPQRGLAASWLSRYSLTQHPVSSFLSSLTHQQLAPTSLLPQVRASALFTLQSSNDTCSTIIQDFRKDTSDRFLVSGTTTSKQIIYDDLSLAGCTPSAYGFIIHSHLFARQFTRVITPLPTMTNLQVHAVKFIKNSDSTDTFNQNYLAALIDFTQASSGNPNQQQAKVQLLILGNKGEIYSAYNLNLEKTLPHHFTIMSIEPDYSSLSQIRAFYSSPSGSDEFHLFKLNVGTERIRKYYKNGGTSMMEATAMLGHINHIYIIMQSSEEQKQAYFMRTNFVFQVDYCYTPSGFQGLKARYDYIEAPDNGFIYSIGTEYNLATGVYKLGREIMIAIMKQNGQNIGCWQVLLRKVQVSVSQFYLAAIGMQVESTEAEFAIAAYESDASRPDPDYNNFMVKYESQFVIKQVRISNLEKVQCLASGVSSGVNAQLADNPLEIKTRISYKKGDCGTTCIIVQQSGRGINRMIGLSQQTTTDTSPQWSSSIFQLPSDAFSVFSEQDDNQIIELSDALEDPEITIAQQSYDFPQLTDAQKRLYHNLNSSLYIHLWGGTVTQEIIAFDEALDSIYGLQTGPTFNLDNEVSASSVELVDKVIQPTQTNNFSIQIQVSTESIQMGTLTQVYLAGYNHLQTHMMKLYVHFTYCPSIPDKISLGYGLNFPRMQWQKTPNDETIFDFNQIFFFNPHCRYESITVFFLDLPEGEEVLSSHPACENCGKQVKFTGLKRRTSFVIQLNMPAEVGVNTTALSIAPYPHCTGQISLINQDERDLIFMLNDPSSIVRLKDYFQLTGSCAFVEFSISQSFGIIGQGLKDSYEGATLQIYTGYTFDYTFTVELYAEGLASFQTFSVKVCNLDFISASSISDTTLVLLKLESTGSYELSAQDVRRLIQEDDEKCKSKILSSFQLVSFDEDGKSVPVHPSITNDTSGVHVSQAEIFRQTVILQFGPFSSQTLQFKYTFQVCDTTITINEVDTPFVYPQSDTESIRFNSTLAAKIFTFNCDACTISYSFRSTELSPAAQPRRLQDNMVLPAVPASVNEPDSSTVEHSFTWSQDRPALVTLEITAYFPEGSQCHEYFGTKTANIDFKVCGYEKIVPRSEGYISYIQTLESVPIELMKNHLISLFEVDDPDCPAVDLQLVSDLHDNPLPYLTFLRIKIEDGVLSFLGLGSRGTDEFYVKATTTGRVSAYQEFRVRFKDPESKDQQAAASNAPPLAFSPELQNIELTVDLNKPQNDFIYTSPSVVSPNLVRMTFQGHTSIPCRCVTISQENDRFVVNIKPGKMTVDDTNTYPLIVSISPAEEGEESSERQFSTFYLVVRVLPKDEDTLLQPVYSYLPEEGGYTPLEEIQLFLGDEDSQDYQAELDASLREIDKDLVDDIASSGPSANPNDGPKIDPEKLALLWKQFNERNKELGDSKGQIKIFKPVEVKAKLNRNGLVILKFNQKLRVPNLVKSEAGRRLVEFNELDVSRDIVQIKFVSKSDEEPQPFYLELIDWTEDQIEIQLNFTKPLSVSLGETSDMLLFNIKNRFLFASQENGEILEQIKSVQLAKIPRQLPPGIKEDVLIEQAVTAQTTMKSLMIIQLIAQLLLKGAIRQILSLYFAVQFICYLKIYAIQFPANADILITEFTKTIEFDILNPEGIIQLWDKDFTLRRWFQTSKENLSYGMEDPSSIAMDLSLFICLFAAFIGLLLLATVAMIALPCFRNRIKKLLLNIRRKAFWNGTLETYIITNTKIAIAVAIQITLWQKNLIEPTFNEKAQIFSTIGCLGALPLIIFILLFAIRDSLNEPEVKSKYGILYADLNLKHRKENVYFIPIFLMRRLFYVAIPTLYYMYSSIQLQLLVQSNILYMIYYIDRRPHLHKAVFHLETFNEFFVLISGYLIMLFTGFNQDTSQQFQMGNAFVFILVFLVAVNIGIMVFGTVQKIQRIFELKKMRKAYKAKLRERKMDKLKMIEQFEKEVAQYDLVTRYNNQSEELKNYDKKMIIVRRVNETRGRQVIRNFTVLDRIPKLPTVGEDSDDDKSNSESASSSSSSSDSVQELGGEKVPIKNSKTAKTVQKKTTLVDLKAKK